MQKSDNVFDRFIDQFSAQELRTRVQVIIVIGLFICAAAAIGGWFLLSHDFFVADQTGLRSVPYHKMILRSP